MLSNQKNDLQAQALAAHPNQNQNWKADWKKLPLLESEYTPDTKWPNWHQNSLVEDQDGGIPTNTMIGMIGEKLTDFFAEAIRIANGLTTTWIVKTTNWSLHLWLDGLVEIQFLSEENVLVNKDCSGMTMTFLVTDVPLFQELVPSLELLLPFLLCCVAAVESVFWLKNPFLARFENNLL